MFNLFCAHGAQKSTTTDREGILVPRSTWCKCSDSGQASLVHTENEYRKRTSFNSFLLSTIEGISVSKESECAGRCLLNCRMGLALNVE